MAYSPNNWVDRVISGALRYDIKDNSGSPLYTQIQILLHNTVSVAGSLLTAAWMNHLEGGLQTADANASSALTSISNNQSDGLALNTSGTSTAFTITTTGAIALTTGEHWRILFNATAGATPTLNRDGKGAKSLKYYNSSGSKVACGPTTIYSGMVAEIIYDGTDYVLISVPLPVRALYTSYQTLLNPTGTTSATGVMMGLGASYAITPTFSGNVRVEIQGNSTNNTLNDGCSLKLAYGTSTAPTNGAASAGTLFGSLLNTKVPAASAPQPFAIAGLVTGLTLGTPYWFDILLARLTGGTATLSSCSCSITEL